MNLIVISGLPCSGKSHVAAQLRAELRWPLCCKDTYKELLFDNLGYSDREWSRRLSHAAYALMFAQAAEFLSCGHNCIVEGNFRWPEHQAKFSELHTSKFEIVQVHCHAQGDVLATRFRERAASGLRHPGHVDDESLLEIESELRSVRQAALPIGGVVVECDTSDDWQKAITAAIGRVRANVNF